MRPYTWITMRDHNDNNEVELVNLDSTEAGDITETSPAKRGTLSWQYLFTRQRVRTLGLLVFIPLLAIIVLLSAYNGLPGSLTVFFRPPVHTSVSSSSTMTVNSIKAANELLPQQDGLVCLSDAAWSPDSLSIAFIGYQKTCLSDGSLNGPGMMVIYDARSAKLKERLSTDSPIVSEFHRLFPRDARAPIVEYAKILWSPDGRRLAISFWIAFQQATQGSYTIVPGYTGLFLCTRAGAGAQVFLKPQADDFLLTEWDTAQGQAIQSSTAASLFEANPLAAAYRWGNNGELTPIDQHSRTLSPVGNTQGGAAFTIWQPGTVQISPPYNGPGSQLSAIYIYNTFFAAWSPDGRYIATISIFAHVVLPGKPIPPNAQHVISMPNVRLRQGDLAFQRALSIITGPLVSSNLVMLSWRPDGRALAAYDASSTTLEVLDCATGRQAASLLLSTGVPPGRLFGSYLLYWSPDGQRLLMFDPDVGQVLTWNVG